ncbi:lytic transglycosylase domain-containing protein [Paraburkholderia sp. IMGN_8]|uniref:lytic transglycosylase domain-containing protein n=1 Tax=Paraburkholderia sp. IMGN_8 TaxID=3136564 RepID=UPI0031011A4F
MALLAALPLTAAAQQNGATSASFAELAQTCAPHVDTQTLAAVVRVESSFNPDAIGVVGGHLKRQPRNYDEAVATAHALAARGFDFSLGLGQINVRNLARFGETIETIFEPCRNLRASGVILAQCFARSAGQTRDEQGALRGAFSCYYSGNFSTGYREGYVARVIAGAYTNARQAAREPDADALAPHASLAEKGMTSSSAPVRQQCRTPDARQFITVRCADNPSRWCTRCLSVTTLAAH